MMAYKNRLYAVYFLSSSDRPDEPRYVGITSDVKGRASAHRRLKGKEGRAKEEWTRDVLSRGCTILMTVIADGLPLEDASRMEVDKIREMTESGFSLVNGNSGGARGYIPNDDVRRMLSERAKGFRHSPETIEKMRTVCRHIPGDDTRALLIKEMGARGPRRGRKYKGVITSKLGFISGISASVRLGSFSSEGEAAFACDIANYAYYGESAFLNFPDRLGDIKSLGLSSHESAVKYIKDNLANKRTNKSPRALSGYKGVTIRGSGRFQVQSGRYGNGGTFGCAVDAAMAYDAIAYRVDGDNCYLNFPERIEESLSKF